MKIVEISAEKFNDLAYSEPFGSIYQSSYWSDYIVSKKNKPLFIKYVDDSDLCLGLAMFILRKESLLSSKLTAYCPCGYLINFYDEEFLKEFDHKLGIFLSNYNVNKIVIEPKIIYEHSKLSNDKLISILNELGYQKTKEINNYVLDIKKYKNAKTRTNIILKTKNVDDDYSLFNSLINNKDNEEYLNIYTCIKPYASLYVTHLDSIKTKRALQEEIDDCTKFINKNRDDYKYIEDIREKLDEIEEVKQILKYIDNLENAYGSDPVLAGVCMIDYSGTCNLAFEVNRDKMFNSENVIFNTVVEDNKAKKIKTIEAFTAFSDSNLYHLLGEFTRHI